MGSRAAAYGVLNYCIFHVCFIMCCYCGCCCCHACRHALRRAEEEAEFQARLELIKLDAAQKRSTTGVSSSSSSSGVAVVQEALKLSCTEHVAIHHCAVHVKSVFPAAAAAAVVMPVCRMPSYIAPSSSSWTCFVTKAFFLLL